MNSSEERLYNLCGLMVKATEKNDSKKVLILTSAFENIFPDIFPVGDPKGLLYDRIRTSCISAFSEGIETIPGFKEKFISDAKKSYKQLTHQNL